MFKRITAIALALVICAAAAFLGCQPTPDHDIIVNRGDDDNIGGASTPTKAPEGKPGEPIITPEPVVKIEVPEHLSILENTSEDVYIKIETDVTADLSGKLPTLAIKPVDTRDNPDFVNRMLALLALQGDYYKEWDMTKQDIIDQMTAITERLKGWTGWKNYKDEQYSTDQDYLPELQEQFITAPDQPEKIPYDASRGFDPAFSYCYYIEHPDGSVSELHIDNTNNSGTLMRSRLISTTVMQEHWTFEEAFVDDYFNPLPEPVITREQAEAEAQAFIDSLGVQCNSIVRTNRSNLNDYLRHEVLESTWTVRFERKIGGVYSIECKMYEQFPPRTDYDTTLFSSWGVEGIEVTVGKDGIQQVSWAGLGDVYEVVSEDTQLLDFDSITEKLVRLMGYKFAFGPNDSRVDGNKNPIKRVMNVYDLKLVYGMIAQKDNIDNGYYIPMWEITYEDEEDINENKMGKLYLSAIDGGYAEPKTSWKAVQEYLNRPTPKPEKPGRP